MTAREQLAAAHAPMSSLVVIGKGSDRGRFLADMGTRAVPIVGLPRHFLVDAPAGVLARHALVESVEDGNEPASPCDQIISIDSTLATGSWALPRIIRRRAPWNVDRLRHPIDTFFRSERDGTGVDIYIVDTGIDIAHPVFGGRASIIYEYYSSGGANDDVGHGTGVASCAAGDVVGVARGANLFGLKIGQAPNGGSTNTALTTAIGQLLTHYAGRTNPAVCNISYLFSSTAVLSAIADLIDAGIAVCGPAGNAVTNLASINVFPAEAPDAICVAGLGMADLPYYGFGVDLPTNSLTFGTNFGSSVSIMAPAQAVMLASASVLGVGTYRVGSGTSYASPMAAGVIACMLQDYQRPTTRTQVQAINAKLLANATSGRLRTAFGLSPLPDRILYLDPNQLGPEPIDGLVVAHYRMAAATGSFAATFVAATLIANVIMTADVGSFALTGVDAQMYANPGMTADVGTFALTGFDANLYVNPILTAAQGSFALTGQDAALSATGDPDFSSVSLLLGFEGTNGATSTTDESPSPKTITFNGNAALSTAQQKFGVSSLTLDGTGDYLDCGTSSDLALTGDFTVEGFIRVSKSTNYIMTRFNATGNQQSLACLHNAGKLSAFYSTTGSSSSTLTGTTTLSASTWYHACWERSGTTLRIYLNGIMEAKATVSGALFNNSGTAFLIGRRPDGTSSDFQGNMDEIRVTKGVARYNSDAGFTVPSAAYPRA